MKVIFKERIQINGKGDVDYTRQVRQGGGDRKRYYMEHGVYAYACSRAMNTVVDTVYLRVLRFSQYACGKYVWW